MKAKKTSTAALSAIIGFGLLTITTPAQAAFVTSISDPVILAKGATAYGAVYIQCESADEFGQVYLTLTRRAAGNKTVSSETWVNYDCTEAGQQLKYQYEFPSNGTVFKRTTAALGGEISTCDPSYTCSYERIPTREVTITNR